MNDKKLAGLSAVTSRFQYVSDFLLFPFAIVFLTFLPNYAHGVIEYNECGQYASVINAIFNGQIIHRDIYLIFGPLAYYLPAWAMGIFGKNLETLRAFFLYSNMAGYFVLYALCRLIIKNRFLSYAAIVLIVIHVYDPFLVTRWKGIRFAVAYLTPLALVLYCRYPRRRFLAAAGLFTGVGSLCGMDIGVLSFVTASVFFAAVCLGDQRRIEFGDSRVKMFLFYLAGLLAVLTPFILYLVLNGAAGAFLRDFSEMGSRRAWCQVIDLDARRLAAVLYPVFVYAVFLILLVKRLRIPGRKIAELAPPLIVGVYGLIAYLYAWRAIRFSQFEASLPLAILCCYYWVGVLFKTADKKLPVNKDSFLGRTGIYILLVTGCFSFFMLEKVPYDNSLRNWYQFQKSKHHVVYNGYTVIPRDEGSRETVIPRVGRCRLLNYQAEEVEKTTAFILAHTSPGEPIFTMPDLGIYQFLADRPAIGRFLTSGHAYPKKEWRDELLRDLEEKKPRVAVLRDSNLPFVIGLEGALMPDIRLYINAHYRRVGKAGGISLFLRKD